MIVEELDTGAHIRVRGPRADRVVLMVNGGVAKDAPGTWSATLEHLAAHLERRRPELGIAEVRYRIRSWRRHEMCIADGRSALEWLAAATPSAPREIVLIGFSLGGLVATQVADHPLVTHVIGLAPWLPHELPPDPMRGRRFDVIHGSLDRAIPLIPGVHPSSSRAGFERITALPGTDGTYDVLPGGLHAIALRAPWGTPVPAPRAREWLRRVDRLLGPAASPP